MGDEVPVLGRRHPDQLTACIHDRAAAIAGPFIWGFTVDILEPTKGTGIAYRAAVVTVAVMFLVFGVMIFAIISIAWHGYLKHLYDALEMTKTGRI